jgi:hypothetical protein
MTGFDDLPGIPVIDDDSVVAGFSGVIGHLRGRDDSSLAILHQIPQRRKLL